MNNKIKVRLCGDNAGLEKSLEEHGFHVIRAAPEFELKLPVLKQANTKIKRGHKYPLWFNGALK